MYKAGERAVRVSLIPLQIAAVNNRGAADSSSSQQTPGSLAQPWPKGLSLPQVLPSLLNLRSRSLLRGTALVLVAFGVALLLTDFPNNRETLLLLLPAIAALVGLVDHVRCMQSRWSWYHGGVLLLIYMDLMVLSMILFFLLYPSMARLISAR